MAFKGATSWRWARVRDWRMRARPRGLWAEAGSGSRVDEAWAQAGNAGHCICAVVVQRTVDGQAAQRMAIKRGWRLYWPSLALMLQYTTHSAEVQKLAGICEMRPVQAHLDAPQFCASDAPWG